MPSARVVGFRAIERGWLGSLHAARVTALAGLQTPNAPKNLHEVLYEVAFLRTFVAWERFLEDAFLSYLMGKKPLHGRPPHRYYRPPDVPSAWRFLSRLSGNRPYLDWTDVIQVSDRADLVFRQGSCFNKLRAENVVIQEMKRVRNAITHHSDDARGKFEELVRQKLTILPPRCTPGSFLGSYDLADQTHRTFLDMYLDVISALANDILRP